MSILNFFSKKPENRLALQIRPHLQRLYQHAYRLTQGREDAEDLVQELLLRLHEKNIDLDQFERADSWLLRTLYHQFVDHYRKKSRLPLDDRDQHSDDILQQIEDSQAGPQDRYELTHNSRKIRDAMQQLNPDQQALVALHDMEGYSLPELAEILDQPLGTLKSRLHRARQTLRNQLLLENPQIVEPFSDKTRFTG